MSSILFLLLFLSVHKKILPLFTTYSLLVLFFPNRLLDYSDIGVLTSLNFNEQYTYSLFYKLTGLTSIKFS